MTYNLNDFIGTYWRIMDGDIYVSSLGSDSGTGSPTSPYQTISKAYDVAVGGEKIVVGTGTYNSAHIGYLKNNIHLVADGMPKLIRTLRNLGSNCIVEGFYFENLDFVDRYHTIKNCTFKSSAIRATDTYQIVDCLFIDSVIQATNSKLLNCTFYNTKVGDNSPYDKFLEILDCHFEGGELMFSSSYTPVFDYCNIRGTVKINLVTYTSLNSITAAYPAYLNNGLSVHPRFNNTGMGDFSLSRNSPLISVGSQGQHIGALGLQYSLHDEINQEYSYLIYNPILEDVGIDAGSFRIMPPESEGRITLQPIDLQNQLILEKVNLFADQKFETPPFNAVVDMHNLNTHPNILTFEMRYANQPLTDEPFLEFAWGKAPSIDVNGVSNGHIDFDTTTEQIISARFVQFRISLKDSDSTHVLRFHGMSMLCSEMEFAINVQDAYGNTVENANITIDDGTNTITGLSDANGCFFADVTPDTMFDLTISKELYNDITYRSKLVPAVGGNNFVCIVENTSGSAIPAADVTISTSAGDVVGQTSIDGVFSGNIESDLVSSITIEKAGYTTYTNVVYPFTNMACANNNYIIAIVIVLEN